MRLAFARRVSPATDVDLTSWAAISRASGFDTWVATPSSANLRTLVTDETGTGALVFADSPVLAGAPTAPTAAPNTNNTQIATTAYADTSSAAAVAALGAVVELKGTWDASAGTFPGSGSAQSGDSWIVSVSGSVNAVAFTVGDRIIAIANNASTTTYAASWFKADYTDAVSSVAGRTGAVTLAASDISDFAETARDTLAIALTGGAGIAITPNDGADTITIAALAGATSRATYAALTALTAGEGLRDGAVYVVLGRASSGDGGEGLWRYDAASTTAANGGTILAIDGGGAGRFFRVYSGAAHMKWFATADGTTNHATAIAAFFVLGGELDLDGATWLSGSRNVLAAGTSAQRTILRNGTIKAHSSAAGAGIGTIIEARSYQTIESSVTIDGGQIGTTSTAIHGISSVSVYGAVTSFHCAARIVNLPFTGLAIYSSNYTLTHTDIDVSGTRVDNVGWAGVYLENCVAPKLFGVYVERVGYTAVSVVKCTNVAGQGVRTSHQIAPWQVYLGMSVSGFGIGHFACSGSLTDVYCEHSVFDGIGPSEDGEGGFPDSGPFYIQGRTHHCGSGAVLSSNTILDLVVTEPQITSGLFVAHDFGGVTKNASARVVVSGGATGATACSFAAPTEDAMTITTTSGSTSATVSVPGRTAPGQVIYSANVPAPAFTTLTTTSGSTAATVASGSGIVQGMRIRNNDNVADGTTVAAISGTNVTLSANAVATGAVASTMFATCVQSISGSTITMSNAATATASATACTMRGIVDFRNVKVDVIADDMDYGVAVFDGSWGGARPGHARYNNVNVTYQGRDVTYPVSVYPGSTEPAGIIVSNKTHGSKGSVLEEGWTEESAAVVSSSGTLTSASAVVRWRRDGRTIFYTAIVSIPINGTGAGSVDVTLPIAIKKSHNFGGREDAVTGVLLQGLCFGGTTLAIVTDASPPAYPGGDGRLLVVSGFGEAA